MAPNRWIQRGGAGTKIVGRAGPGRAGPDRVGTETRIRSRPPSQRAQEKNTPFRGTPHSDVSCAARFDSLFLQVIDKSEQIRAFRFLPDFIHFCFPSRIDRKYVKGKNRKRGVWLATTRRSGSLATFGLSPCVLQPHLFL